MTKNLNRCIAGLTIALTSLVLLGAPARALNLVDSQLAVSDELYDSRNVGVSTQADGNRSRAINISYVGSSTEATVAILKTGLTFYAPNAVADTTIGSSGVLLYSAYTTIGTLCDAINASASYHCVVMDARRSDVSDILLGQPVSAAGVLPNLGAAGGFDVAFSSGNSTALANEYFLSIGINPKKGKSVILKKCEWNVSANGISQSSFSVSGVKRKLSNAGDGVVRDDSTVVWLNTTSTGTAVTQTFGDASAESGLQFAPAFVSQAILNQADVTAPNEQLGRVVARVTNYTSTVPINPGDYLRCYWVER